MMKIIGLDVGTKRIGVAKADTNVKIAVPAGVIEVDGNEFKALARLARLYGTDFFVVGLPRSNEGRQTTQSAYTKNFANDIKKYIPGAKVRLQDESLTSVEAKSRLTKDKKFKKLKPGAIDAEAAAIILQDFLEGFGNLSAEDEPAASSLRAPADPPVVTGARPLVFSRKKIDPEVDETTSSSNREASSAEPSLTKSTVRDNNLKGDDMQMNVKKSKKPLIIAAAVAVVLAAGAGGSLLWYNSNLAAVNPSCPALGTKDAEIQSIFDKDAEITSEANVDGTSPTAGCPIITFTVDQGDSSDAIAKALKDANLIKSPLAFKIYAQLSGEAKEFQAGEYSFTRSMTAQDISAKIARGEVDENVFSFTIIPGQNIFEIQKNLATYGYSEAEIAVAFGKNYSNSVLKDKPSDASLEGYLYPDTYEFYKDATVEEIIETALKAMEKAVAEHGFEQKFAAQGLSLNEGITLASIVEEESVKGEYANVAGVFMNRLDYGMALGSDVTAKYAADLVDLNREVYTDNSLVLTIDSPYNTRKYSGLPPAPIANPSLEALEAVANPTEHEYFFFLTGDDGLMYYSTTESGHNQNATEHCQELCNVSL